MARNTSDAINVLNELRNLVEIADQVVGDDEGRVWGWPYLRVDVKDMEEERQREIVRDLARLLPGHVEKRHGSSFDENEFLLEVPVKFEEMRGTLVVEARRDAVCEKRYVGKKTVQRRVYPDAEPSVVTEEVDAYEWDCDPLLKEDA